uniref:Uncharacterized protein n=1 Tax=Anguilla anguilla TaxID=7936 RepID=A0A0E9QMA0_ANGAN
MIGAAVTIYSHSQSLSSFTVKKEKLASTTTNV